VRAVETVNASHERNYCISFVGAAQKERNVVAATRRRAMGFYTLRSGPEFMGFQYARRPFVLGFKTVEHARHVHYNVHPIKANIRMRLTRGGDEHRSPEPVGLSSTGVVCYGRTEVGLRKKVRGLTVPAYQWELCEALRYTMKLDTMSDDFTLRLPFEHGVGVALAYDVLDETRSEVWFQAHALHALPGFP